MLAANKIIVIILLLSALLDIGVAITKSLSSIVAIEGRRVTMDCLVPRDNVFDQLYSIKWYKQHEDVFYEFYSLIKSPEERLQTKSMPGVVVQSAAGGNQETRLTLETINSTSAGLYKCEVVSEIEHRFHTHRQYYNLSTIVPQRRAPQILSNQNRYKVGDIVTLTCVSDASQPSPSIGWLINGREVLPEYLVEPSTISTGDNTTTSTTSILKFKLRNEHLIDGEHFSVQCRSYLAHHFAPEEISSLILRAWHETTPLIVGLHQHYQLGDRIRLNCTVPAFYSDDHPDTIIPYEAVRLEWIISGHKAKPEYVVNYFRYGHIGLDMILGRQHLYRNNLSLSIECKSRQRWPKLKTPTKFVQLDRIETMLIYNNTEPPPTLDDDKLREPETTHLVRNISNENPLKLGNSSDEANDNNTNVETYLLTQLVARDNFTHSDDINEVIYINDTNITTTETMEYNVTITSLEVTGDEELSSSSVVVDNQTSPDNSTWFSMSSITDLVEPRQVTSYGVTLLPMITLTIVLLLG